VDCGYACTNNTDASQVSPYPYILCTSNYPAATSACEYSLVPENYQVWNPVAAFNSVDTNGVILSLPSVPSTGAATATGTLTFGIGTEANNALTTQTIFEADDYLNFASAMYNGLTYTESASNDYLSAFLDSGSNGLFVSDPTTLGVPDCTATDYTGFYCPTSTFTSGPLTLNGVNGTSTQVTLSIANAQTLVSSGNAAYDNLGGPSCVSSCSPSTDYWDLGLPFFYGHPIYVGITFSNSNYPNGYWAF